MKYILAAIFTLLFTNCDNALESNRNNLRNPKQNLARINWRDSVINLGTIKVSKSYPLVYYFTNTGSEPLLFEKIESTCGCTVIDRKINNPILPNHSDSIIGHFKLNATGIVERKIYILANTHQNFHILRVKANVTE